MGSRAGARAKQELTFDDNNHIVGASYDASGDLLSDAAGHSYTYDANHRIVSADNGNIRYVYNALGQRVEKIVGGVAKYYLYDPAGRAVTVLDQSGNWLRGEIFAGGRHIATYVNNTTNFDYSDWLGTERLTATLSGTEQDACTSLPYGDDFACSGPGGDPTPLHFTGQEHDNETGLDHFPARDYTAAWAVFTRPDPAPWNLADPQTLDRYVYTADNPVTLTDPTGLTPCAGKSGAPCKVKNVVEERHPGSSAQQKKGAVQKVKDWVKAHPKTTKAIVATVIVVTAISGAADEGASEAAIPEEEAAGAALESEGEAAATEGQTGSIERTAEQGGRKAVERSLRSYQRRLAEHVDKLGEIKGDPGSVQREINNFRGLIKAAEDWLSKNP